jgi:geranylgeranyl pyrophosphate synthase
MRPIDLLAMYALKTAPAFEAALYAGLRMAEADGGGSGAGCSCKGGGMTAQDIRPFCRYLGVAYQITNDLNEWNHDTDRVSLGSSDVLWNRPSILKAFACEAGGERRRKKILAGGSRETVREIYETTGAFAKAERLAEKYRRRALAEAERTAEWASGGLADLMRFVVETVL